MPSEWASVHSTSADSTFKAFAITRRQLNPVSRESLRISLRVSALVETTAHGSSNWTRVSSCEDTMPQKPGKQVLDGWHRT